MHACEIGHCFTNKYLLQFYPYGNANGDASLPYPFSGEGSSLAITLSQDFVFFDQVVRTAYVCLCEHLERCKSSMHKQIIDVHSHPNLLHNYASSKLL